MIIDLDSNASQAEARHFGAKGHSLWRMAQSGVSTPLGFVIGDDQFKSWASNSKNWIQKSFQKISELVKELQRKIGKTLGLDLKLAVRGSSQVVMPGILLTKLDVASMQELVEAIQAVFQSWTSRKCIAYRKINSISDDVGLAVIVQEMIDTSSSGAMYGTAMTRDPMTGQRAIIGQQLQSELGDKLMSGLKTPEDLNPSQMMLQVFSKVQDVFGSPQEIQFAVRDKKIVVLQAKSFYVQRYGTRSAVDLEALRLDYDVGLIAKGKTASPITAIGALAVDSSSEPMDNQILALDIADARDISRFCSSRGFISSRGGVCSHLSALARQMMKAAVVALDFKREDQSTILVNGKILHHGDLVLVNGQTGQILRLEKRSTQTC